MKLCGRQRRWLEVGCSDIAVCSANEVQLDHVLYRRWIPLGQLVPPITNRANYIHWLEDLLGLSAPEGEVGKIEDGVRGGAMLCGGRWHGWSMPMVWLSGRDPHVLHSSLDPHVLHFSLNRMYHTPA